MERVPKKDREYKDVEKVLIPLPMKKIEFLGMDVSPSNTDCVGLSLGELSTGIRDFDNNSLFNHYIGITRNPKMSHSIDLMRSVLERPFDEIFGEAIGRIEDNGKIIFDSLPIIDPSWSPIKRVEEMSTELIEVIKLPFPYKTNMSERKGSEMMKRLRHKAGYEHEVYNADCFISNLNGHVEMWSYDSKVLQYYLTLQRSYTSLMKLSIYANYLYIRAIIIKKDRKLDFEYKCNIGFRNKKSLPIGRRL